jgi:N-acetylglucosaminyldiphosphoundecaprenol N-acetyl-beta-D-mannosaminyltransferase
MNPGTCERVNVLGVGLSDIHRRSALELILEAVEKKHRGYICVTGVHGVMEAQSDPHFRLILNSSFLTVPDGTPLVWVGRMQRHRRIGRVYGPDLMIELCRRFVERGYRHFLYGGQEGVAEKLALCLQRRIPGLQIAGTYTPPFVHSIRTRKPNCLKGYRHVDLRSSGLA